MLPLNTVIYWVRSVGPQGKERVPMYFLGQLRRNTDEGNVCDVKARPVALGKTGNYTAVYGAGDFEQEDGTPINFYGG